MKFPKLDQICIWSVIGERSPDSTPYERCYRCDGYDKECISYKPQDYVLSFFG